MILQTPCQALPAPGLVGTSKANVLTGSARAERLDILETLTPRGLGGDDCVLGGTGNDLVDGGAGDDEVRAGAGNDSANGGAGADLLDGGTGNDTVVANDDSDVDTVTCGSGNDVAYLGAADVLVAGNGCELVRRAVG